MNKFILKVGLAAYDKPLFISNDIFPSLTPIVQNARVFTDDDTVELRYSLNNYILYLNTTYFPKHYGDIVSVESCCIFKDDEDDKQTS